MSLTQHFVLMADYNRWMNAKIYEAASRLNVTTLHADQGAFFGSVFGTLNHLLVADTIWLQRFSAHPAAFAALTPIGPLPPPRSLSEPLHADLAALWVARQLMDAVIVALCAEATESDYAQPLAYANRAGQIFVRSFGPLMQHFFNHQTHHRGQATTLLSQAGVDVGVTDLLALIPNGAMH